ncbi:MAG: hypothetical protein U0996_21900 [Planctomycetaceae bacterium]
MDPLAAWKELLNALTDLDWERVLEAAENLVDWIANGGFPPEVIVLTGDGQSNLGRFVYGPELNRSVVTSACRFAIQLANGILENHSVRPDGERFRLSCIDCDSNGPESFEEAIRAGWARIQFVPESHSRNYLGVCPECRKHIEAAQ